MTDKKTSSALSAEEKAAMKELVAERRAAARRGKGEAKAKAELEDVLTKINEMPEDDRQLALKIHQIVTNNAPQLAPRTWYGMPAYALEGKVLCFFQSADKFNSRYASFGFNDNAALDEGVFWPTAFAITEIDASVEERISEMVVRACRS